MARAMPRAVQVPLALDAPQRQVRRRRRRPDRQPPAGRCPECRGPLARGEGHVACVVCGRRRAA